MFPARDFIFHIHPTLFAATLWVRRSVSSLPAFLSRSLSWQVGSELTSLLVSMA